MAIDQKDPSVSLDEGAPAATGDPERFQDLSPEAQKRIKRQIDRRLIGTCGVMYCISLIDRTNLSAAAIAGMNEDLNLINYRYSILILVFFITYTVLQPPATVLVRKLGPRPFLAGICFAWGVVMLAHGLPHQWGPMVPLRLLLGAFEAGFFPGCLYLISTWYTRYDLHRRYSFFYVIGCVATGFGGILAYGLMQMDGLGGYGGWRWIFIIEGIITTVIAVAGYFLLVDFPDVASRTSWRFISQRDCEYVMQQIEKDRDDAEVMKFNLKDWARSGLDLKVWGFAFIYFFTATPAYAGAYFTPIILRSMGFSLAASQLLVAPPYIFAGVLMIVSAYIGDKCRTKAPILVFNGLVSVCGLALTGFASGGPVRYVGIFLTIGACQSNFPTIMAYQANNIRGQWKRAFCSATLIGFGGLGGIVSSLIFRTQDAPLYRPGIITSIVFTGLSTVIPCIMSIYFIICNRKADRGELTIEGLEGFRYTI